ncbi:MAG: GNAT family N-acetyltransferase [Thaumarchaeota archaeon]|nr:GNAT family N-acetyltransferase [Nitrososphaerota archaeon]MCL5318642.1 GNAT family N-acetyltransferase [Nitrososphaerota archaeon]
MPQFHVEQMPLSAVHRPRIEDIIRKVGVFNNEEIAVAVELVDQCLAGGDDYMIHVAVDDITSQAIGYICFGRRPFTDGVYDMYWIAVDPDSQQKGVGKQLLESIERVISGRGGRMILAETSSRSVYQKARGFYEKSGFQKIAEIKDFYSIGDALLIYQKHLKR